MFAIRVKSWENTIENIGICQLIHSAFITFELTCMHTDAFGNNKEFLINVNHINNLVN